MLSETAVEMNELCAPVLRRFLSGRFVLGFPLVILQIRICPVPEFQETVGSL